jgi:hypothetical protein
MADVGDEIEAHLLKAMELSIRARGLTGKYAIIAQAVVDEDGTFVLEWQQYRAEPGVSQ